MEILTNMTPSKNPVCVCGHEKSVHYPDKNGKEGCHENWLKPHLLPCDCPSFRPEPAEKGKEENCVGKRSDGVVCTADKYGGPHALNCPRRAPEPRTGLVEVHKILQDEIAANVWYESKINDERLQKLLICAEEKLSKLLSQTEKEAYSRGYQEASEKAGHHFIYEEIPAREKEAEALSAEKMREKVEAAIEVIGKYRDRYGRWHDEEPDGASVRDEMRAAILQKIKEIE